MNVTRLPRLNFWGGQRLPLLLQTESAECGLACLAMVASHFGHHIDLPGMRRRFSVSLKGTTLKSLIVMAEAMGLQTRPLKLQLQELGKLQLPCILHWNMNHFVVLHGVRGDKVIVHDPAAGRRELPFAQVSDHFTGVALELTPGASFKPAQDTQQVSLRSLLGHVVGLKRSLVQLLVLGIALQVCALAAPFYMQWVVDEALVANDRDLITVLGVGFLLLVLMQTAIGAVRSWITTVMATHLNFQWFGNAFSHLMKLPLPYFERRHLGDIVSRFGSIQTIQHALTTQVVEAFIDGLLVAGTLAIMLLYSPALTAVAAAAVGLYAMLRWSIFRALREATAEQIIHAAKQQTHFLESARGIQSVRLFGRAEERRIGWMNILADQFNAELRIARLSVSHQTANSLLFGVERVAVIWLAALAVASSQFSVGMLFAFIAYTDQFTGRLASLIDKLFELRMLRLHGERVADIVTASIEQDAVEQEVDVSRIEPSLEVRNLSFRHADGEAWVLRHLNFKIPAGQCVAIAGASGCGKTTLVKLLLGLLEPTEGEVLVGGERLSLIGRANYRQIVGSVMQEDHLFAGSIAENISFFDQHADSARITEVAMSAAIHHEIVAMPMAYNTLVGDVGSGLSGGQRQRILLARALYRSPRILILDEATSHLDEWNEQAIAESVKQMKMTRVLVAHRPETIASADRVILLERGQIIRDLDRVAANATVEVQMHKLSPGTEK
jgi:ATP-binding cassette subfamily B protein RaxB